MKKSTKFLVGFGAFALIGALITPHGDTTTTTSADNRMTRSECANMEAAIDQARASYNEAAQMIADDPQRDA